MANILITGVSGYIGGHAAMAAAKAGHAVRGTVRDAGVRAGLSDTLSTHAGHDVPLDLFSAELGSDAGWEAACEGVDHVLHIASPIPEAVPSDMQALIPEARGGALRVLAAARNARAKRVVMTSSVAAVVYGHGDELPARCDETVWSDPANTDDHTAYTLSKTVAERAAWDFMEREGGDLELSTINPSAVLGPVYAKDFSSSVQILTQILGGKLPRYPRLGFEVVDVRDVADAHLLAMEAPEAAGERFIVSESYWQMKEVGALLREALPGHAGKVPPPDKEMPDWMLRLVGLFNAPVRQLLIELGKKRVTDNAKARRVLGWSPRPAREAIIEGAESLVTLGAL